MSLGELTLRRAGLELVLAPDVGGSIARFDWVEGSARRPILRPAPAGSTDVLAMGSFPLVPYVNRIRGGRFTFRGREVQLEPNMAGDASPLHGQGWLSPWEVASSSETEAVLRFTHQPGEWPWAYEAEQRFAVDEAGLELTLRCRNRSADPMPCGLGQHPYFNCGAETRIGTEVSHVWTIDEQVLPVEKVPASGRFDLTDRPVCGQDLDHGFGGWSGTTRLTDPQWPFRLQLRSATARFFQLYSPATGGIFVAEPVTHANAALNAPEQEWPELGMRVLEPGEELHLDMRLDVRRG